MDKDQLARAAWALINQEVAFDALPLATREGHLAHAEAFLRTGTVTTQFDEACLAVVNAPRSFEAEVQGQPLQVTHEPAVTEAAPVSEFKGESVTAPAAETIPTAPLALPEPVATSKRRGKK